MEHTPRRHENTPQVDNTMRARTLALVAFFLIFGFGLLLYQLYALQLRDGADYRAEAVQQQLSDIVLPATRGSIYSANGKLLAKSSVVWNIVADPSAITEEGEAYLREGCEHIAAIIDDETVTADSLLAALNATNAEGQRYSYRVLARGLDMPTADAVLEYARGFCVPKRDADGNILAERDGTPQKGDRVLLLYREQNSSRSYPYGAFLSSVIGFLNNDGQGFYGLEKSYDELLSGTPGRMVGTTSANGYELEGSDTETFPAIDGYDLHLTIDENVQEIAERYLAGAIEVNNVQNRGCVIVMEVKTGAIKAMATLNQFDPNDPYTIYDEELRGILEGGTLDAGTTATLRSRLGEDEVADIVADGLIDEDEYSTVQGMMREAQWKNKNLTELYYPGSVFKLITASASLDSGLATRDQSFTCGGAYTVNGGTAWEHTYTCAQGAAHGLQDMGTALNNSCNIYFAQLGKFISPKTFFDYFDAFGFTEPTGIDLPNETRWMIYHDQAAMEQVETNLLSATFGQNMAITPMQMATAVAAVVNGGYLVTPYVVDSVTDQAGNIIQKAGTDIRRQVISEEVSAQLRDMMENNVGHGDPNDTAYHSCRKAYVAGYRIGGKSGTAEQLANSKKWSDTYRYAMSFVGVLPMNDPELLVFVMLDDPRGNSELASDIMVPVVGNIISEVAPYLGIEQAAEYAPSGTVKVQNTVGTDWATAQVNLNRIGLSHQVIGPTGPITYQYPYGGMTVPAGSTVYLYTEATAGQSTIVPDAIGKTGTFAVQMLRSAGVNVQLVGDAAGRVVEQDTAPDTTVEMGTVVTLTTDRGVPEPEPEPEPEPQA